MMATHKISKPFEYTFLLEFKKGYNKDVGALLLVDSKQKEPALLRWWIKNEKIKVEAERKYGLLVFQRNRMHPCIVMTVDLFNQLEQHIGQWKQTNFITIDFVSITSKIIIVPLYPFLNWCSSKTMKLFINSQVSKKELLCKQKKIRKITRRKK